MGILAWIILGLIAGFIASRIVHNEGAGCALDIVLGIVGAFIGGIIFRAVADQVDASRKGFSDRC
jgi:uncharacterized membrane protein YeaQ/YmgE (transglycosylase-associated protein family)